MHIYALKQIHISMVGENDRILICNGLGRWTILYISEIFDIISPELVLRWTED